MSPTLAGLYWKTHVYACLLTSGYIPKISNGTCTFQFAHVLKLFKISVPVQVDTMDPSLSNSMPIDLLNATEDSSLCNLTPISLLSVRDRLCLEQEERATASMLKRTGAKAIIADRGKGS